MPRLYFDVYRNGKVAPDTEGSDCPDLAAARREAMAILPEVVRSDILEHGDTQQFVVVVRDESGTTLYTATLNYAGLTFAPRQ